MQNQNDSISKKQSNIPNAPNSPGTYGDPAAPVSTPTIAAVQSFVSNGAAFVGDLIGGPLVGAVAGYVGSYSIHYADGVVPYNPLPTKPVYQRPVVTEGESNSPDTVVERSLGAVDKGIPKSVRS